MNGAFLTLRLRIGSVQEILIEPVVAKGEDSGTLGSFVAECRGLVLRTAHSLCFHCDSMLYIMLLVSAFPILLKVLLHPRETTRQLEVLSPHREAYVTLSNKP